jgi:Mg2+ and Co2+ transporter CorA
MGLTSPASAPNLTALREFPSNTITDPSSKRSSLETLPPDTSSPGTAPAVVPDKPKVTWWLDVGCPTWEDLRDIGELLSLHPLTLEDVLQQDPREKMDVFEPLGYYFIVVRALDEPYFKYTPGTSSVTSVGKSPAQVQATSAQVASAAASTGASARRESGTASMDEKAPMDEKRGDSASASPELAAQHAKKEGRRRGWGMGRAVGKLAGRQGEKVEIVEDNPGKEGLEGVGVGAVNVYMAVFDDGIITVCCVSCVSWETCMERLGYEEMQTHIMTKGMQADEQFHFDDISKHTNRVRERVLSGAQQNTADGLAHGLLDSVVDAFFPLVRYVDGEVDDLDSLTIDPTVLPRSHARNRANTLQADGSVRDIDTNGATSGSGGSSPMQKPQNSAAPSPEGFGVTVQSRGGSVASARGIPGDGGVRGSAESSYNDEKTRYPPRKFGLRERFTPSRLFKASWNPSPDLPTSTPRHPHPYPHPYPDALHDSSPDQRPNGLTRRLSSCLPSIRLNINLPALVWTYTYLRLFFLPVSSAVRHYPRPLRPAVDRNELLQRIVEVRRIVTGMTRMLGAKHQVVGRLRKRLEDGDLAEAAYVGDVEGRSIPLTL